MAANDNIQSRRLQFRLSTIFVFMLVVAAFFGGVAVQRLETERVRQELQAERKRELAEREQAVLDAAGLRFIFDQLEHPQPNAGAQASPND